MKSISHFLIFALAFGFGFFATQYYLLKTEVLAKEPPINYRVKLLFEEDGIKVYQFTGIGGRFGYYSDSRGSKITYGRRIKKNENRQADLTYYGPGE